MTSHVTALCLVTLSACWGVSFAATLSGSPINRKKITNTNTATANTATIEADTANIFVGSEKAETLMGNGASESEMEKAMLSNIDPSASLYDNLGQLLSDNQWSPPAGEENTAILPGADDIDHGDLRSMEAIMQEVRKQFPYMPYMLRDWLASARGHKNLTADQWNYFLSLGRLAPSPGSNNYYYPDKDMRDRQRRSVLRDRRALQGGKSGKGRPMNQHGYTSRTNNTRWKRDIWSTPLRKRKEYRQLSLVERTRFHNALNLMKTTPVGVPPIMEYDIFVALHQMSDSPAAHFGAAFLPWHREYLWRFERALQQHEPDVALPYWDSTLDQKLPEPRDSVLWLNQLLGDNSGPVSSGPFAGWTDGCGGSLTRNAQPAPLAHSLLFDDNKIDFVMNQNEFKDIASFTGTPSGKFEGDHGGPHVFVGGDMGSIACAPSDPAFWMHHAFVDCIWEWFRRESQTTPKTTEYPSTANNGPIGGPIHEAFAPMDPFVGMVNIHGLSSHYTTYYYECKARPSHCYSDFECGSLLWCNDQGQCVAKVRLGGDCTGLPDRACYSRSRFKVRCDARTNKCTTKLKFALLRHKISATSNSKARFGLA